jgi:plastocyanin
MNKKPGLFAIVAVGLIVTLTGCGASPTSAGSQATSTMPSTSSPATTTSAAQAVVITIKDFKFTVPASVAAGTKITVKNQDAESHTVTSATAGAFNVKVDAGGTATFTAPTKAGSYPFGCMFHGNMMGTLVVI